MLQCKKVLGDVAGLRSGTSNPTSFHNLKVAKRTKLPQLTRKEVMKMCVSINFHPSSS
jgi:hypothetical protein